MLPPLLQQLEAHVFAVERLHGDDTTVPVLATGKTETGRCLVYVRDDRPFGGQDPPAAMFYYSRDRGGEHPARHLAGYSGILQADAYGGYNKLYEADRKPGAMSKRRAGCMPAARSFRWPIWRRARVVGAHGKTGAVISPLALEAVRRIDTLFEIERAINGQDAEQRRQVRQELSEIPGVSGILLCIEEHTGASRCRRRGASLRLAIAAQIADNYQRSQKERVEPG